jgi:hypothetical protein
MQARAGSSSAVALLGPLGPPAGAPGGVLGSALLVNSSYSRAVPPGMAERARRHAAVAQLQLLAGLPLEAVQKVQVGATLLRHAD